jgi:hypothetical protein
MMRNAVALGGCAASARSAPRPHEMANGELGADEDHEPDEPLVALGRTVGNDNGYSRKSAASMHCR